MAEAGNIIPLLKGIGVAQSAVIMGHRNLKQPAVKVRMGIYIIQKSPVWYLIQSAGRLGGNGKCIKGLVRIAFDKSRNKADKISGKEILVNLLPAISGNAVKGAQALLQTINVFILLGAVGEQIMFFYLD